MQLPIESYKMFGLLAVVILVFGLTTVVVKWPEGKNRSFSHHIARQKNSIVFYSLLFSIALPILLLFFLKWFIPTFNLPFVFGLFVVLSSVAQFSCTLVPETGGKKSTYHGVLAGLSAFFLIPTLITLLFSEQLSSSYKILVILSLISMLRVAYELFVNKGKHSHFLLLQSAYFISFFIPILAISYL